MKEMLTDESGHINLGAMFRPFRSAEAGLAKAETAEEAIRCCQEFLDEEGLNYLLQQYGELDVSAAISYMRSILSTAEAKGGKLGLAEVEYLVWSIEREIPFETILSKIFTDRETKPSGNSTGIPKGNYEKGTDQGIVGQNHAADVLAQEGYDITMLEIKEEGNGYGISKGKNPDFLIEGRAFDAYTPQETATLKTIKAKMRKECQKQTTRIVLVLDYYKESVNTLKSYILQQTMGDLKYLEELKVVVDDHVET